jgi:hypothetical protein
VTPLAPFAAEHYLVDLRDQTAAAPEGSIREIAYLWACGALDVRDDCLLIPVLVTAADAPLLETLERRNIDRSWNLPPNYFRDRLEYGGCLLLLEEADEVAAQYPLCRIVARAKLAPNP